MKMGSGMFWGILLIVIGLCLVVKIIFHIDFPVIKILFAFVLIYLGIKILVGPSFRPFKEHHSDSGVYFGKSDFDNLKEGKDYDVVFGKGTFDLRKLHINDIGPTHVKVKTVFGDTKIILPDSLAVKIDVEAAFAGVTLPNGNTATFGSTSYSTANIDTAEKHLVINADVVFGALKVEIAK